MTLISKTTFTYTVMHRTDSPPADVYVALGEAMDGHMIGQQLNETTEDVPAAQVKAELIALGNDGGFFDWDLEDDRDRD